MAADTRPAGNDVSFTRILGGVATNMDVPFGYTLTVWSAGALSIARYGSPTIWNVLEFVGGGVFSYLLIVAISVWHEGRARDHRPQVALINVSAIVSAIPAGIIPWLAISADLGFFATAFMTTLAYPFLLALFTYVERRVRARQGRQDR